MLLKSTVLNARNQNRSCSRQITQCFILSLFFFISYIYFDNILNVFRVLRYKTMQLANKSLFVPPQSLYIQHPEKRLHLPDILFSNAAAANSSLCEYTKLESQLEQSIDSNGNICKIQDINKSGCCPQTNIIKTDVGRSCASSADISSYQVPYKLYSNDALICCSSYVYCIDVCLSNFIAKPFDLSIETKYKFDNCKYICRTSSKSTTKSRYYIDPSYKYCFGNAFYPNIQYNIMALLAPSFKLVLTESGDISCKERCKKLNINSDCSVFLAEIFSDDCKYHQQITSTTCKKCKTGKNVPSIQYLNTEHQICYKSSKSNRNVCNFKSRDKSQQNICLCSLL